MSTCPSSDLAQEWHTLQNNIEQYEKSGLLIKLTAVVVCAAGLLFVHHAMLVSIVIMVLWIQEGIFRTFQSRLVARIAQVEQLLRQDTADDQAAYQLHSQWLAGRAGTLGLLREYALSMLRPTVAFPYPILMLIALASLLATC